MNLHRKHRSATWLAVFVLMTMARGVCRSGEGLEQKPYRRILPGGIFIMQLAYPHPDAVILRSASGERYPASGLYPVDGSNEPRWTVDWFSDTVRLTDDGRYLVRIEDLILSRSDLGLAFYDRGKLLKQYAAEDLKAHWSEYGSFSHFEWLTSWHLNQRDLVFSLRTMGGHEYLFDIASGETLRTTGTPWPPPDRQQDSEATAEATGDLEIPDLAESEVPRLSVLPLAGGVLLVMAATWLVTKQLTDGRS